MEAVQKTQQHSGEESERYGFWPFFHEFMAGRCLKKGKIDAAKKRFATAAQAYMLDRQWEKAALMSEKAGDIERAVIYYQNVGDVDSAVSLLTRNKKYDGAIKLLSMKSRYMEAARLAESIDRVEKALELYNMASLYEEKNYERLYALLYGGKLAEQKGLKEQAIKFYKDGSVLHEKIEDPVRRAIIGNWIKNPDATCYALSEVMCRKVKELEEKTRYKMTKTLEEIILMDVKF